MNEAREQALAIILQELLEDDVDVMDSDHELSSENEELDAVEVILNQTLRSRHCITNYMEVISGYNEEEFITNFRISLEKFEVLATQFRNSDIYQNLLKNPSSRLKIDERKSLLIFLWFAGHRGGHREIKDKFDLSLSSVHDVMNRVIQFLSSMAKDVIKLPSEDDKRITADFFMERKGFPNIIGCIDGSHIKIDKPSIRDVDYFNRKDYYSMNIQAVCNEKKKFIDVFIGYRSVHDARVFKNSSIHGKLPDICRNGYYLLGDSAYPLTQFLMVPFRDNGHLTEGQKKFNKKLSGCRIFIEHAFGILKERFPQLYNIKLKGHQRICHFIRACMTLHNFAREEDLIYFEDHQEDDNQPEAVYCEDMAQNEGRRLRNTICENLN